MIKSGFVGCWVVLRTVVDCFYESGVYVVGKSSSIVLLYGVVNGDDHMNILDVVVFYVVFFGVFWIGIGV